MEENLHYNALLRRIQTMNESPNRRKVTVQFVLLALIFIILVGGLGFSFALTMKREYSSGNTLFHITETTLFALLGVFYTYLYLKVMGDSRRHGQHLVWHRQAGMLFGISCFLLAFILFFNFDLAVNNPLNGYPMDMINAVLIIPFCFFTIRAIYFSIQANRKHRMP